MGLIFLAYANSETEPLPTLSEEDREVYRTLTSRYNQGHYQLHRESNADLSLLTQQLVTFREELMIFVFSGHAGRDRLVVKDGDANAKGIAQLLSQCPQLKLVVLNGCSTEEQVQQLLSLENAPVVIATSAPVEDKAATQFAITFFQCLSDQYASIMDAFEVALAAAQSVTFDSIEVLKTRDLLGAEKDDEKSVWGIFFPEGHEIKQEWSIPLNVYTNASENQEPNILLLDELIEHFALLDRTIQQIMTRRWKE